MKIIINFYLLMLALSILIIISQYITNFNTKRFATNNTLGFLTKFYYAFSVLTLININF